MTWYEIRGLRTQTLETFRARDDDDAYGEAENLASVWGETVSLAAVEPRRVLGNVVPERGSR